MTRTKEKSLVTAEAVRPYVQRALTDPQLRDDLLAAFVAARGLYGQLAKGRGVKGKAEKVSEKHFQRDLQELVAELTTASERIQGKAKGKTHKLRNRLILLTGATLVVLYNPWTGASTREWVMDRVSVGDGDSFDELGFGESGDGVTPGNGSEPA